MAIHQPNFFPWLGYFDKIARSDVFVVLDHVQFPKSRPGSWSNRVQLEVNGEAAWVTMPVVRAFTGVRRIDEIEVDNASPWRRKLLQLLRTNYGRAAAFAQVFPVIEPLVTNPAGRLADYNLHAITTLAGHLGLPTTHLVRSSGLGVGGQATELLVGLVARVGGTVYLAGDGATGYQQDELFEAAGLGVEYQRFQHPEYPQRAGRPFLRGLSVLDAVFHCGFDGAARLLARRAAGAAG